MQIGIVCEGPSDVPAVECFFGDQLRRAGIEPKFRNLFPDRDNTRPEAGWSNLILWLLKNPPDVRIARYFSKGLFGGQSASPPLDAILIQMDADVVEDAGFQSFVEARLGIAINDLLQKVNRGSAMSIVIGNAAKLESLTQADQQKHVIAIAVDATETWCLAAFRGQPEDFEDLRGSELTTSFMAALEKSEGREVKDAYANCDKDLKRRERYCKKFAAQSPRIAASCNHFAEARDALMELATFP